MTTKPTKTLTTVIKASDLDEKYIAIGLPEINKGIGKGSFTLGGEARWLLQTEPLIAPFGLSIRPNTFDKLKGDMASLPVNVPDHSLTKDCILQIENKLRTLAAANPDQFMRSTNMEVIDHGLSKAVRMGKGDFDDMMYPKVYLSKQGAPQIVCVDADGVTSVDPAMIGQRAKLVLLLDVSTYWLKNGKEMGISMYVKQVQVLDMGGPSCTQPLFVQ